MIRSLSIDGFRGFEHFEMRDLGRVNLLVGSNNSGKTSVLEAIQILTTGHPRSIWDALSRRGERLTDAPERRFSAVDIRHLFHGHAIDVGAEFRLKGVTKSTKGSLTATIQERPLDADPESALFEEEEEEYAGSLDLLLKGKGFVRVDERLPMDPRGGLSMDVLRRTGSIPDDARPNTRFIATGSVRPDEVVSLFERVVLTPEEDLVIDALKTIEPAIERIATRSKETPSSRGARGGIVVKCSGVDQPIPIGSLGDGVWRMLGLALALVDTKNGVLLIDEIDTGLHFTVMSDMWKLVAKTAKRLNVQVFATTHSGDAVDSLAAISRADAKGDSNVTIQRLERDKGCAVAFTGQEIVVAAERGIEVR